MANAVRTISMRIRGLDEETGVLSDGLKTIQNDITELTGTEISLFTDESMSTYRSTYDILKDIAAVWNEIDDTNQAQLLELLAGKTRANELSSILSNFSTAESVVEKTANSTGNAMKEFEKAQDSLSYKLNALKETGTGIIQNVFDSDAIKTSVDLLTDLLGLVDKLTSGLGGLGTILGAAGAISGATGLGWRNDVLFKLA